MTEKDSVALVPRAVREVTFYNDTLLVALVGNIPYVAIRPIADFIGIDWSSQRQRIQRDEILNEAARLVLMAGADGRQREMFSLPLELLPGWLFGVTPSKARPEYKEKLTQYRRDCFHVLWQAFQSDLIRAAPVEAPISSLMQVRGLALAVAQMAEQQIELQEQVASNSTRIEQAIVVVGDLERRLKSVEEQTSSKSAITNAQAAEISNQVKALAEFLTRKQPGKNHYQSIFGELYRRFGVSSYKLIRQEQYQFVLNFLEQWRKAALKESSEQDTLF
jgi:P22_AR N-terminal domain